MVSTDFDVIVLGLGPGGEEVAERVAETGQSVLGVDPALVGGECPYYGCIPSKMMLRGAGLLAEARRIEGMAGHADIHPDYAPVGKRIRDEATDDWHDRAAVERLERLGGTFVRAAGRLAGRDTDGRVLVEAGGQTYRGRHVVVATGTAPALPPVDGLGDLRTGVDAADNADGLVWTNREAVKATTAPASLIILGGGAVGCELGQAFARFGTKVTIIEAGPRILGPEEPEASAVVTDVFRREGMEVLLGDENHKNGAKHIGPGGDGVQVTLADGTMLTAEKLLLAAGRRPNLTDIGLETVGLDPQARTLSIDEHMRLTREDAPLDGLYAIGDITGHGAFTHVAVWQARVLIARLLGQDEPYGGYHGLSWVTFTDPEVGRVGLTEEQARKQGIRVRTGGEPMSASSRGWIHGPGNDGLVKIVEDADRGVLVGATIVSPYGGELLGLLTLAVHAEVPVTKLASMHYAFPTLHRAVLDAVRSLS
jgi:pyruvate/2-oxoglutarate dehydrogenase complex dihydrolipoamide dehydrogenase (E3) component